MYIFERDYKKVYGSIASSTLGACANEFTYVLDYEEYYSMESAVKYLEKQTFTRNDAVDYLISLDFK